MSLVAMRNICKQFSQSIIALDGVDFSIDRGEVISLLGENGAGKTTLMKILFGMVKADQGEIFFNGEPVLIDKPLTAIRMGIYMVHQHFMLIPAMSVLENIIIGNESGTGPLLDLREARRTVVQLIREYNFDIDVDALVRNLSVGQCQRVELLKALYRRADILILDEPTAVLTPYEVTDLFRALEIFRREGKSIIIITHKLKETLHIADKISVLRNGTMVKHGIIPAETSAIELSSLMVGRSVNLDRRRPAKSIGDVCLTARNITVDHGNGNTLKDISLSVRKGEILGIAGVEGNGQSLLLKALVGLETGPGVNITVNGKKLRKSPKQFLNSGVGHIPEDRTIMGIIGEMSIKDNIILGYHRSRPFCKHGMRDEKEIDRYSRDAIEEFAIKADSGNMKAGALSGGNQQKVMLARTFSQPLHVLIVAQPTRGVDVGSVEYIHNQIIGLRDSGVAILLVSADLDEIYTLSDRISVIYEGEIVAECLPGELTKAQLGLLMTGNSLTPVETGRD